MEAQEFKAGDVVALKSAPEFKMTVVHGASNGAEVRYVLAGELRSDFLPHAALQPFAPPFLPPADASLARAVEAFMADAAERISPGFAEDIAAQFAKSGRRMLADKGDAA